MTERARSGRTAGDRDDDYPTDGEDLVEDLADLAAGADSPEAAAEIRETQQLVAEATDRGLIDSGVRRLDRGDVAEAVVGSVVFASPLLIEDGIFDIAAFLFERLVFGLPVFLVANTAFVVVMTYALLEWTGRDRRETHLLAGVVPVRVVMVLVVSFVVAAVLMTVWGRVGDWRPVTEALARVNVLWTVGALGAALGDLVSPDGDAAPPAPGADAPGTAAPDGTPDGTEARTDGPGAGPTGDGRRDVDLVADLHDQFDDLEATLTAAQRREVRRLRDRTHRATVEDGFGQTIRKYTTRDIAEAFVGSVFFSIGFLVEDGVFDVADYFLTFRVGRFPVFFVLNAAFVVGMIWALVYRSGPQDVQMSRPLLGVVPRRLVGISAVSFLTAAMLMTMWGRVGGWEDPVLGVARVTVVWTVASFGAALGDVLPGESSGDDINDELADLETQIREVDLDRE